MNPLTLLGFSIACYLLSSVFMLIRGQANEQSAIRISGIISTIGGVFGAISGMQAMASSQNWVTTLASPFYFADFIINIDALGAFMVLVISLIMIATSIYSLHYLREYFGKGAWGISFFLNLFVAAMVALVVSDNAFYFIVFFEVMSLASYFLVLVEQSEQSVKAGLQYFIIAHTGSVLIMIAFFMLYRASGSLNFADFSNLDLPAWEASVIFLLAFFGFGAKAGMITLHGWLPLAHPAAPSHASALMSGVMVKIGVFGIIKVGLMFLGGTQAWWGYLVLAFGAISSVLGVMYALAEHDIKRLLAYHTVENVGIILMGVGVAMIGTATGHPVFAALGLLGALYHILNHAVFKGLLFLGAGSVIYRTHTKDMEKMGGLAKLMPYTAITFLIGTMAISALPPLNGFVSEWFIYQSLFSMSQQSGAMSLAGPAAVVMLAITGALACMCFVKVYGICFCGMPRTEKASQAREVPKAMIVGCVMLAALCVILGVGSPWISPYISEIATRTLDAAPIVVKQGAALHPVSTTQAILSTPVITIALLVLLLVPAIILRKFKGGAKLENRHQGDPWACGYSFEKEMSVSAGGVTQALRHMFAPVYRIRYQLAPGGWMSRVLAASTDGAARVEPLFDQYLIQPFCKMAFYISGWAQKLQGGDFRVYCLYIVATLIVLLFVPFGLGVK